MLKLNINDLVHILKQIKIAENHTATGELVDHLGNPLNNLTPYGLRTVSGVDNNLVNLNAGAADMGMPRQTAPVFVPAEPNPRTNAPTSYQQTTGSVYDSQPRIISNLIADQTLTNPIAVITALNNVGITGGAQFAELVDVTTTARFAINEAIAADKALITADTAWVAANSPASGALFDARETALANAAGAGAQRDLAVQSAQDALALVGVQMQNGNLVMPNIMPDLGSTAPLNGFMTIFGQFFDHGLTMINKGGSGTVFVPLQPDDPLYVPGSPTNFMVMSRATNGPGADGILGTADDVRDATNTTTPWIDLNQTYASHESTQVFLREYKLVDGKPVATGWLLESPNGGPPSWADVKLQAREMLGIELSDMDVHRVPLLATDLYGNFIPGANGFAQIVTGPNLPADLVEGNPAAPVAANLALSTGHAFIGDIAHNADPKAGQIADEDLISGNAIPVDARGNRSEYDNELLDSHYVVGDGRGNENIALTAIHHVFHSEHNHRVDQIKDELIANSIATGDFKLISEYLAAPITEMPADTTTLLWNGERLFQAARFSTEQVYQHLVFEEFARLVSPNVDAFVFSNTVDIDPAITAEFAHVVYRFGHSQLNETVDILAANGQTDTSMTLVEAFLNPAAFAGAGATIDEAAGAIFRGMTRQVSNEIDEFVTDALRNDLVGLPLDLATLNIARGRDTGMASLNLVRADFYAQTGDTQLKPYDSWFDFALAIKNPASVINFIAAYGQHETILAATTVEEKRDAAFALVLGGQGAPADRVDFLTSTGTWNAANSGLNTIDFWIGGLAEKKMAFGGLLGSTFNFVFEVQMENLQAGDRFYYLSRSQGMNLLNQLEGDSWAKLAMRNTDLGNDGSTHLPSSIFLTPAYTLELNQNLQNMADPVHDNFILQAISPLVMRKDTNKDGTDDYLRYNGVDHVVLGGTVGNDTLIGGEGDDTLWGGKGNDNLEGGQGIDHISGGYGDDVITDAGTPVGAADVLNGDEGNDVISSGEGLDLVFGGSGQDFILSGRDNKTITSGEGNDFARGGEAASFVAGNEGDDWLEGGVGGVDMLAGENSELFFNSPIIGHDVMNGRGNDTDYDAESGDDIMFQGLGIQRNNGMAGFDWAINKDNPVAANSDLGVPIFVNQQNLILTDRYDLVEGLSGWNLDDTLTGREIQKGAAGAGAAAVVDPTAPFMSYSNALTTEGVARIDGFADLVAHLGRETIHAASGEQVDVVVFNQADLVRNADGFATDMTGQPHDIILGGSGSDRIEGKAGNDIIDGDRWLNVRIGIAAGPNNVAATAEHMSSQVRDLNGTLLFGGKTLDQLMLDRTLNPGQLSIVREILDTDIAGSQDTAVYRGELGEYEFVRNADGSTTVTHVPPANQIDDGTDRLFNIEKLTFADGLGGTVTYDINAVVPVAATGAPTINNITPTERDVLSVDLAGITDPNGIFNPTYQWQMLVNGVWTDIVGADQATFTPGQDQVGAAVRVNVAWFDLTGTFENLNSAATAPVIDFAEAATGGAILSDLTPFTGQTLTITGDNIVDPNGVGPLSHQWQILVNGVWSDIAGATGTSYTTTADQLGAALRVKTTFNDVTLNTAETVYSTPTAAIAQGPVAATGTPVISDLTPTETQAVSVDTSSIADVNGLGAFSYQWQQSRDGGTTWNNIPGATAASFTPGDSLLNPALNQVGAILRVAVSFTDGLGTVETLNSTATGVVGDNFTGITALLTTFNGTAGDDIALGANAILGAGGNDTMNGLAGNDSLDGRTGNDTITGGAGNDTITGGAGTDTAAYAGASSNFTLNSNGTTITVTDNTGAEGVDTVNTVETLRFNGVNHTIANGTAAANTINGAAGSEVIFALAGNDIINGGAGNDLIYAAEGVDSITQASATGGRDFVDGGAGEDTFTITSDTTTAEAFVIYTRAAAQAAITGLVLNANTEIVVTRNGAVMAELDNIEEIVVSTLRVTSPGGANGGTVSGDSISVVGDFNQTSLNFNTITIDGNTGNDVVDISALQSAHRIVFTSNGGQDTIVGTLRPQDIVNLDTAAAAPVAAHVTQVDALAAPAPVVDAPAAPAADAPAPVAIEAVAMAAPAAALVADMVLTGSSSDDYLAGDAGDDSITGGSGYDYLEGGLGDDRLSGGSGNDSLVGGDGDDTLSGGSGNDYLDGGLGDDELIGGTGIDAFAFGNGDTIADFMAGDVIDLRDMGVTAGNFAEKVLIEAVRGGSRITIDGQSMMVANTTPAAIEAASLVLADPVAPAPAPVVDAPAPVVDAPAPVVDAPAPVVDAPAAPAADAPAPAPVVDAPAPVVDAPAPVVDAPAPVVDAPAAPAADAPAPAPVVDAPAPVVDAPAPVVDAPAPVVDAPAAPAADAPAPAPVVDAPAPVVDAPAPVVDAPAPVVDAPAAPAADAPAPVPVVDAPAPVVDAATDPNRNTVIAPPTPVVPAPVDPVADASAPVVDAPATQLPVVDAPAAPVVDVPAPAPVVDAPAAPLVDVPAPAPVVDAPVAPVVDAPVQTPVIDVPAPVNPGQGIEAPVAVDPGLPGDLALEPTPSPFGDVNMRGSQLGDVLIGDDDGNELFGYSGRDTLYGMAGDDVMNGGRGADQLHGGEGDDRLFGGRGFDYLDGGEGADVLTGGRGSDIFAFGDRDVITDFKSGEDMIDLASFGVTEANFETMVSITRQGSDLKLSIAGQVMTLEDEHELEIDDFMFAAEDSVSAMITDAIATVDEASPAIVDMVAVDDGAYGPASYESLFNLPADLSIPNHSHLFGPMM
ncbi:An_peroxidase_bacterial_2 domain containing protein [Sphingomonadaceae bacterium]